MVRRCWFVLLACFALALPAGCQKAAPPEPEIPENVDGQKVYDALSTALMKAVTSPGVATGQPVEGAEGGDPPSP